MTELISDWMRPELLKFNTNILLVVDKEVHVSKLKKFKGKKILLLAEPEAILPNMKIYVSQNGHLYDHIITYDVDILKNFKNSILMLWGQCWIDSNYYNNIDTTKKLFKMSSITGEKALTKGHKLRRNIYDLQQQIAIPNVFYMSRHKSEKDKLMNICNNPTLEGSKIELFDTFKYSLVIENSRQTNYFTEKLIDCLITKTIPIYWGCPNISNFFDITGWIILESDNVDENIKVINNIKDNYDLYHDTINKNYDVAKHYAIDVHDKLNNIINSL
jgi:hypothetical protein